MGLLYEELTYAIRGCLFKIYNALGPGHKESVYQNAVAIELAKNNIKFVEQKNIDVFYENKKVGNYRPDFIIEDKIIVELKATDLSNKNYERQLDYYLKGSKYQLGLLVNFGLFPFKIRRIVWESGRKAL